MRDIVCKNCDKHFKGNFCPNCGQSAKIEPIGIKYFLHDIPHSVFHLDKGFPYTFKELLFRPGKTLREYLDGKRVRHFKPFAYVIIMATLYLVCINLLHVLTIFIAKQNGFSVFFKEDAFFKKYLSAFFFVMIPFASLATWLVLLKDKYNYWEHFLVNTYLTAQLSVLLFFVEIYKCTFILIFKEKVQFTYFWFITGFMFYIAFVFRNMLQIKGHKLNYTLKFMLLCFLLAFVYMTGMSLVDIMTPWWGK